MWAVPGHFGCTCRRIQQPLLHGESRGALVPRRQAPLPPAMACSGRLGPALSQPRCLADPPCVHLPPHPSAVLYISTVRS